MTKNNQKFSLHVRKEAKDNTFEDCDIQGAKIDGQGTKMIKSRILHEFIEKRPKTFWLIVIGTVPVLIGLFIEYKFLK
ncbi:MAG: hypothetical protein COV59_03250 [Candidatus Magasanikbacteria bacterium CG11_big_fil_rev_8_21_14_0_20_39_34]|uniref:Uncharacterized protein n=1 Tax=Candidatus Magasanikbacteria bacterium CG11_big_fil_rev_8_21_14_0_20_39_34 TaxID=1974653 RepID=A0A2H0N7T5_9BACT|nr:MAG: hypothetical protein COV59_03250 [Candidatus Magasanikbacteria bacterium CG11_big_fil_rev_8_21_14_0_20_39_34]